MNRSRQFSDRVKEYRHLILDVGQELYIVFSINSFGTVPIDAFEFTLVTGIIISVL